MFDPATASLGFSGPMANTRTLEYSGLIPRNREKGTIMGMGLPEVGSHIILWGFHCSVVWTAMHGAFAKIGRNRIQIQEMSG